MTKPFPVGAWLALFGVTTLCWFWVYRLWNSRGPESWYRNAGPLPNRVMWNQFAPGMPSVSTMFAGLRLASAFRYGVVHVHEPGFRVALAIGESVGLGMAGLGGVTMFLIFFAEWAPTTASSSISDAVVKSRTEKEMIRLIPASSGR